MCFNVGGVSGRQGAGQGAGRAPRIEALDIAREKALGWGRVVAGIGMLIPRRVPKQEPCFRSLRDCGEKHRDAFTVSGTRERREHGRWSGLGDGVASKARYSVVNPCR